MVQLAMTSGKVLFPAPTAAAAGMVRPIRSSAIKDRGAR
jgi:hypothetical protein